MAAVTCLADIAAKVKMDTVPWGELLIALGDPVDHEELACIPKDMFIKWVTDFEKAATLSSSRRSRWAGWPSATTLSTTSSPVAPPR